MGCATLTVDAPAAAGELAAALAAVALDAPDGVLDLAAPTATITLSEDC